MRLLRFLKLLIRAIFGDRAARALLRHDVLMLKAIDAVMIPFRRGDFEAALEAAERFRFDTAVADSYFFYRGACLAQLDKLPQAEIWLRRCVAIREENASVKEHGARHLAIAYSSLGELLLQSSRWDEAVECFEISMRHYPDRSSGCRHMAEALLLRGSHPAEALRWASLAVEKAQGDTMMPPAFRKLALAEVLATQAWAVAAASHDSAQVARLAAEAVASVGTQSLSSIAAVHYHSGRAFQELGDTTRSEHHFGEAARIDRQGKWGRAARTALTGEVAPKV